MMENEIEKAFKPTKFETGQNVRVKMHPHNCTKTRKLIGYTGTVLEKSKTPLVEFKINGKKILLVCSEDELRTEII